MTFIGEAWTRHVQRRAGETQSALLERGSQLPPSKAEDKSEVLLVGMCYRDDDSTIKVLVEAREILRDDTGAPVRTEPFPLEGGLPFDATIGHLLPPPRTDGRSSLSCQARTHACTDKVWSGAQPDTAADRELSTLAPAPKKHGGASMRGR